MIECAICEKERKCGRAGGRTKQPDGHGARSDEPAGRLDEAAADGH